jgi:hypothetical protein
MVFGKPVTGIAEAVGQAGEADGFLQGGGGVAAVADRGLVEDAELDILSHGAVTTEGKKKSLDFPARRSTFISL